MVDLVLDARKLPDFGIGSYIGALLRHLPHQVPSWTLGVLVTPQGKALLPPLPKSAQVVEVDAKNYSVKEQLLLPVMLARLHPRLVHIPHYVVPWFHPWRLVVTVHDIIHVLFPEFLPSPLAFAYANGMIRRALRRAQRVITVSQVTAADLQSLFGVPASKLVVIPNGVESDLFEATAGTEDAAFRKHLGLTKPYFLYVGNHKPHKNVEALIKAYQLLVKKMGPAAPNLVLAGGIGPDGPLAKKVEAMGLSQKVWCLGFLPRKDLIAVYRGALAFVYPSLYEGFGLPVLEAAACAVPVIASDIPAVREVLGDAVVHVNPKDIVEQARAMERLAREEDTRRKLAEAARAKAEKYRWEKTAESTGRLYRQVLGEGS